MLQSPLGDASIAILGAVTEAAPVLRFGHIQSTQEAFDQIFTVFLALGTIVGIVVTIYMLHKAYKYREGSSVPEEKRKDPPELGELPGEGEGGRKLFVSFAISAVIVLSLIFWTYGTLLHVSDSPDVPEGDQITVEVEGYQFGWGFTYPNGHTEQGTLRVPNGTVVNLEVTSRDVMHNLGLVPFERKTDAIPGQYNHIWVLPEEPATYENGIVCYELCGAGHSAMTADIVVMEQDAFDEWYASTEDDAADDGGNATDGTGAGAHAGHDHGGATVEGGH